MKKRDDKGLSTAELQQWFLKKDDELAQAVHSQVDKIQKNDNMRQVINMKMAQLYTGIANNGFANMGNTTGLSAYQLTNVSLNAQMQIPGITSAIDTLQARIAKERPRVSYLTLGGDDEMQRKAQDLTKYTDGVFYQTKAYSKGQRCFVDGAVYGNGFLLVTWDNDKIGIEHVYNHEVIVDVGDGIYKEPKEVHIVRLVSRYTLKKLYPKHADKIQALERVGDTSVSTTDLVRVVESWRLPTVAGEDGTRDGKHSKTIKNCTLEDEDWDHSWFPLVTWRWKDHGGFWGKSLAFELAPLQLEVNKCLNAISRAQQMVANPKLIVHTAADINDNDLNNEPGGIIVVGGPAGAPEPHYLVPSVSIAPDVYQHLWNLWQKIFEASGVSLSMATGTKEPGVNAAVAMRERRDDTAERFQIVAQDWGRFYVELADRVIKVSRMIYKKGNKNLKVAVPGKRFIEDIKWKTVDMEDDHFLMRAYETGQLPQTPEGRLQAIQEMLTSGLIEPDWARQLLNFPDLERMMDLQDAARNVIRAQLDDMLKNGVQAEPDEYVDLEAAKKIALVYYCLAKEQGIDDDKLEMVRQYIRLTISKAKKLAAAAQGAAPQQAPTPTLPEAAPMELAGQL